MTTAIDTSVLWAIINAEPGYLEWLLLLEKAADDGPLLISPVTFAELAPSAGDAAELLGLLSGLRIQFDPLSPEACHRAGMIFKQYRAAGGPRAHLIPDFLIATHALVQADQLAVLDRGYLRRWFPHLKILSPLKGSLQK